QREQLEADIAEHAIYGKLADRLMFCFHQSQHSFRYRHDLRRWGLQLEPLKASVLDVLASRNVEWLLSWRSRDVALLSPDPAAGPFDPAMLSYALWTQHMKKANCTLQASVTKSYTAASLHQHGSVLLQPGLRWADEPAAEGHGGLVPDLNISSRRHREAVTRLLASKIGQQLDLEPLVELAAAETQSAHMTAALAAAQQSMFNQWAVGLARYTWHLPSLKDGQLRVQLDAAPLTCNPRCRMVGLSAREAVPKVVFAGPDTAAWVPLLRAQDHSLAKAANVATPGPSQKYTLIRLRDASPLTDLMRDALSQHQATLLVLGSLVLTHGSGAAGSNPATHSFTHFVLRSFALPLLLVTQHCNRPLMRYMAGLLTPQQKGSKGDKLVLTQVLNLKACKPQLVSSMRTVLDKFLALAESYSLRDVVIQHLEPPFDRALLSAIKAEAAQLLAVQMPRLAGPGPAGTGGSSATPFAGSSAGSHGLLPPQLLSVIRGATVPLLIYPDRHVEIGQDAWGHRHLVVNTSSLTNGSGAHIATTTTSRMGLAQV
ncbi:uncharacterized protein HaLaN_06659, partial [Haematococcus lacustris]